MLGNRQSRKGRLGEQALSLGSLIFTAVKNALFTRRKRSLFTVYCDEIQNLVASGSDIETVLSEARKFGVAIVSANQFLDQYPAEKGKSALAYKFASEVQFKAPEPFQIVLWVSAKKKRFEEGTVVDIDNPDFSNLDSAPLSDCSSCRATGMCGGDL